jgi:Acetyltransferase (GNAT) domain
MAAAHNCHNISVARDRSVNVTRHFQILHEFPSSGVEKLWREFLKRASCPAHYDSPAYFLEPYWSGQQPFAILAFDRDAVIGVATGLHLDGKVACGLPERPQVQVDEASAQVASQLLAEGLIREAGRAPLVGAFSWSSTPLLGFLQRGFGRRDMEGVVTLDLRLGADTLFKQFHSSRRRNIRWAIKAGIEVTESKTHENVLAYWNVYSAWRQTERKVIRHNRTFEMWEKVNGMRTNHRRFLAWYDGKVIAASGLRFHSGGLVESANNCSLDAYLHLHPNDLLTWRTIQWACENGFTKYSCGSADEFHRRSGGVIEGICRYRLDRTFLHRYDVQESLRAKARFIVRKAPHRVRETIENLTRMSH